MNANEFIKWYGSELQDLIRTTDETNRSAAGRDLVSRSISNLMEIPSTDRAQVLDVLVKSHQSQIIGDFRVPFDDRVEFDTIEAILATIEAYLEG